MLLLPGTWIKVKFTLEQPSINPNPRQYLEVSWIHTLPCVTWEAVTVVEGIA